MVRHSAPSDQPADLVVVGRITGAYGVRGWIKISAFADQSVLLGKPAVWIGRNNQFKPFTLEALREQGADLVASIRDASGQMVTDRDVAGAMKGMELAVTRRDFPPADPDEFYWVDLVGCQVVNATGDNLGRVIRLEDHGADPVMILQRPNDGLANDASGTPLDNPATKPTAKSARGASRPALRLIPFVSHYVLDVDLASQTIRVDWDPAWD